MSLCKPKRQNRAVAFMKGLLLMALCFQGVYAGTEELTTSQKTFPIQQYAVDLIPGVAQLVSATGPAVVRQASSIEIETWLEIGPYVERPFQRYFLMAIEGIDVARVFVTLETPSPGQLVRLRLPVYVPRNVSLGPTILRGGFLPKDAPGEARRLLATRLAPLLKFTVTSAEPLPHLAESDRAAMLANQQARGEKNLLINGGFESGLKGWEIDGAILAGADGWRRQLAVIFDPQGPLEGKHSLRIDFGGGQDISFWHISHDAPVAPDTEYILSYFTRTEDITSSEGPFCSVESIGDSSDRYFKAAPRELRLTGTHNWTFVKIPFHSRSNDHMMRIRIRRSRSAGRTDGVSRCDPIQGSVWFDSFWLEIDPQSDSN